MGSGESGYYYTSGGSKRVHHHALIHSIDGKFTHNNRTGKPQKLVSGGHGQNNINVMKRYGISFTILKTYPNGVRIGNVARHPWKTKRFHGGQAWFPKEWTTQDVVRAGEHVAALKNNRHEPDGVTLWGTYKGVKVGIIKRWGQIQTIFPSVLQPKGKQ